MRLHIVLLPSSGTHLLKMNFQFQLKGQPIEEREALALFSACGSVNRKPYPIDIEKILDTSKINSNELFNIAVENGIADLASLAFKVSVAQRSNSNTEKIRRAPSGRQPRSPKRIPFSHAERSEDLIDALHNVSAYWAVGVASIMNAARSGEWMTLREIAIQTANRLDKVKGMPSNSVLYKGFVRMNGELQPLDLTQGIDRKRTFHVSPMYIGLREGLIWCTKKNLVEQRSQMSTTTPNEKTNFGNVSRVFYKLRATERGSEFVELWADIENYIESFYKSRSV